MDIVCILGNGFDINLGLQTRYSDFYKYYFEQPEPKNPAIRKLREQIREDLVNWSDLEIALGSHCKQLQNEEEVADVFYDISEHLAEYLAKQETMCDYTAIDSGGFVRDILSPEVYLTAQERQDSIKIKNSLLSHIDKHRPAHIEILTFNYTRSVEHILSNFDMSNPEFAVDGKKVTLGEVNHIHGQIGETPVLGLNDESQIDNPKLVESVDAMEICIKQKHNNAVGEMIDHRCANIIDNADVIIIFGSSIGLTDRVWWERIGERLLGNCMLFIFTHSDKFAVPTSRIALQNRFKRNIKQQFISKTDIPERFIPSVLSKIFVGINKPIFSI